MRQTCWQSGSMFIFRQSALTHCAPAQPLGLVWCVRNSQPFLSLLSTLIPGEHVRWNSPPIKTGISQVRCGNQPECGKTEGQTLSPFLTDTQPHSRSLLFTKIPPSRLSHPYCNSSSSIFSPYILSFLNILIVELASFLTLQLTLFKPPFIKAIFHCFPCHFLNYAQWAPSFFLLFSLYSPSLS